MLDPRRPGGRADRAPHRPTRRRALPLVGELVARAGRRDRRVYVSEAMVELYGARAGTTLTLPLPDGSARDVFVRGVWRDYARQHGAIAIDARRLAR